MEPSTPLGAESPVSRWLVPLLFVIIMVFTVFMHLDTLPIRTWDEARQTISAIEMFRSGNFLVTTYNGEPDMWSTKPPFLIWCQVLFCALIGTNELAIRLPSAIAAALTGWFLLRITTKEINAPWLGLLTCLVLYERRLYPHACGSQWRLRRDGDPLHDHQYVDPVPMM